MNTHIGNVPAKRDGDISEKLYRCLQGGDGNEIPHPCVNVSVHHKTYSELLPWNILGAAYFFFDNKGFEKTTIQDICTSLGIHKSQFYSHFESLDEVLEILWTR